MFECICVCISHAIYLSLITHIVYQIKRALDSHTHTHTLRAAHGAAVDYFRGAAFVFPSAGHFVNANDAVHAALLQ